MAAFQVRNTASRSALLKFGVAARPPATRDGHSSRCFGAWPSTSSASLGCEAAKARPLEKTAQSTVAAFSISCEGSKRALFPRESEEDVFNGNDDKDAVG